MFFLGCLTGDGQSAPHIINRSTSHCEIHNAQEAQVEECCSINIYLQVLCEIYPEINREVFASRGSQDSVKAGNYMVLHNRTVILRETQKTERSSIKPELRCTFWIVWKIERKINIWCPCQLPRKEVLQCFHSAHPYSWLTHKKEEAPIMQLSSTFHWTLLLWKATGDIMLLFSQSEQTELYV